MTPITGLIKKLYVNISTSSVKSFNFRKRWRSNFLNNEYWNLQRQDKNMNTVCWKMWKSSIGPKDSITNQKSSSLCMTNRHQQYCYKYLRYVVYTLIVVLNISHFQEKHQIR